MNEALHGDCNIHHSQNMTATPGMLTPFEQARVSEQQDILLILARCFTGGTEIPPVFGSNTISLLSSDWFDWSLTRQQIHHLRPLCVHVTQLRSL